LSLILLFDQFPRNMFRGSVRAFAYDAQALALTLSGMQSAADAALDAIERMFFYMPLQHAESREVQTNRLPPTGDCSPRRPRNLRGPFGASSRSAENHRAIIEQFGRFPHRNRVLGRANTRRRRVAAQGGEQFGQ